jgi:CDP-diacylglycerol--glycerol-3-phosphate 3-phosphatidyltransferase
MNLPNKLTIARMCAIPVIIVISVIPFFRETPLIGNDTIITLEDLIILIIFCIASFTDFLDGHIARKRHLVTDFGKFMDPLADKLLVLTALMVLLERGRFTLSIGNEVFSLGFVITLILAREFAVTGIRLLAADNQVVIAASHLGKIKTISQMAMIIILLLNRYPFALMGNAIADIAALVIISLSGALTIISGIDYFIKNKNIILNSK